MSTIVSSIRTVVVLLQRRLEQTPVADRVRVALVVAAVYISSSMLFFGMNFWLWSFREGSNTFVSIFIPAAVWPFMFGLPYAGLKVHQKRVKEVSSITPATLREAAPAINAVTRTSPHAHSDAEVASLLRTPRRSVWSLRFCFMLAALGLIDALGGLTAVYSATSTPVLVQSMLVAGAPLYTYLFSRFVFRRSVHPVTTPLVGSAVLLLAAIAVSLVPQILSPNHSIYVEPGWLLCYLASAMLPTLYNVVQGRFLADFSDSFDMPIEAKLVALCGDTFTQLFFTAMFFPLDSVPHFGPAASMADTWDGFVDGTRCIFFECRYNFIYFLLYVVGLWLNRLAFTYLNYYNPTVGSVVGELTQPINTCLLLIFPALNVFGQPGEWWSTLVCFVLMTGSMVLLVAWHESHTNVDTGSQMVMHTASPVLPTPKD